MAQLQKEVAVEAHAAAEAKVTKRAETASSSGGGGKRDAQRETVAEGEEVGGKRVCGELCRGTKQKPGKRCRVTNLPCRFHAVPTATETAPPSEIAKRIDLDEPAAEEVAEPAAESTKIRYVHAKIAAEVWEENLRLL